MSQEKLGEAIGLTFQQVQKYERGSNRISAGTLFRLGQVLDVPVSFFFDAYHEPGAELPSANAGRARSGSDGTSISRRDARLLRLWRAAPQPVAEEILALLASLSPDLRDGGETPSGTADAAAETRAMRATAAAVPAAGEPRDQVPPDGRGRRPRRRHGAVWDPADIYRAKSPGGT